MKCKPMKAGRGGWTEWVCPTQGYLFQCCDCGLVHEMQFKVFAETKQQRCGRFTIAEMPWPMRTMFRARRRAFKGETDAK